MSFFPDLACVTGSWPVSRHGHFHLGTTGFIPQNMTIFGIGTPKYCYVCTNKLVYDYTTICC